MDNEQLLQAISEMINMKLKESLHPINSELGKINERLDKIDERLDKTDERLDKIDERLDKTDERLDKIDERLDKIEGRLGVVEVLQKRNTRKLDDLSLDLKIAERDIKRDIHDLNDEMDTVIEILKIHDILPR